MDNREKWLAAIEFLGSGKATKEELDAKLDEALELSHLLHSNKRVETAPGLSPWDFLRSFHALAVKRLDERTYQTEAFTTKKGRLIGWADYFTPIDQAKSTE